MLIRYSTLKSRLLLPPMTRPVRGSRGPTVRRSNPRMLYSPPRYRVSKIGSVTVLPYGLMYSPWARKPSDVRRLAPSGLYQIPSARGLTKFVFPPKPAQSNDNVYRDPDVGKIGWSTVLYTKLGAILLIVRRPFSPMSNESYRNG